MQPQPSRQTDHAFTARRGVRRGAVLQPADRRMLQAVRDNLSHLRRPAGTTSSRPAGTVSPRGADVETSSTQNSSDSVMSSVAQTGVNCSRLDYNKKALDEIRQELRSYHVTSNYEPSTSHSTAAAAAPSSDNMVRQVILLGADEASEPYLLTTQNVADLHMCSENLAKLASFY